MKHDNAPATGTQAPTQVDRATTFQPLENAPEAHNGATLLVEAYAILWAILFGWLLLMWRKQTALNRQIAQLERAVESARR